MVVLFVALLKGILPGLTVPLHGPVPVKAIFNVVDVLPWPVQ